MPRFLLLTACLTLICATQVIAADEKSEMPKVTFADDVLPIFRSKCGSCHNASDKKGGLVLDNYAAMMLGGSSGNAIEPGDAANSYLWSLITHESEPKMPPNADKLPDEQLAIIEKWINLGAPENSGSKVAIKKKPSLAKIEISTDRPAEVALPQRYYGDPVHVPAHLNAVTALATSPWAPLAAVSGFRQIGIYDTSNLHLLGVLPFPEGQPQIAKFSRNGSLLLVGGGRGGASGRVVVYDVRTGERKVEIGDEYDVVLGADISPDQTLIALGGPKRMLRVYSLETGELLYEKKKHTDWITSIEFSPDGVLLASGDRSNGLVVWEAFSGEIFYDLQGHKGSITDVSWRPDSNVVASASEDGTIKLWDMQNGNTLKSWNAHGGGVTSMDYTREGNLVSTGRDNVTRYWKGDGGKIRDLPKLPDLAMEVAYDAETKRILAGDWTGHITIWNAEDGTQIAQISTNPPTVQMQLTQANEQLSKLQNDLKGHQSRLAALRKAIDDRMKVAQQKATEAANAAEAQKQATAKKQQAEATVKAQQEALKTAERQQKEAQATVASLNKQLQQHLEKKKATETAFNASKVKVDQLAKAHQDALNNVQALTSKADAAAKAAQPTEEEKAALESDEAVRKAVEERQKLAQAALAALKQGQEQASKAEAELKQAQQQQAAAQKEADAVVKLIEETRKQMTAANTAVETAGKEVLNARKKVEEAQAAVTASIKSEQAAAKAAQDAKTASQKAAEAAKPKEEEQKAIAAEEAAIANISSQITSAEANIARLQKIATELNQATAAQQ